MQLFRLIVIGTSLLVMGPAWAQNTPKNLDCSAKAIKKAEMEYQQTMRPLLATVADSYSGKKQVLIAKERKRSYLFKEWLKMRCICKVRMSHFETMLCEAVSERTPVSGIKACLVLN